MERAETIDDRILEEIVQTIVAEVRPEQIVLFGSRAEGTATDESDVDLLVVESEPFGEGRSRRGEMVRLWKALEGFRFPKDILVYSSAEVRRWRGSMNHVVGQALRQGRVLYARP